jgi:hypothetical protein
MGMSSSRAFKKISGHVQTFRNRSYLYSRKPQETNTPSRLYVRRNPSSRTIQHRSSRVFPRVLTKNWSSRKRWEISNLVLICSKDLRVWMAPLDICVMGGCATSAAYMTQPGASGVSVDVSQEKGQAGILLKGPSVLTCLAARFTPSSLICTKPVVCTWLP